MHVKLENKLLNLSKILLIMMPFFLITGPLLSEISILVISLSFLYISIKNNNYFYFSNIFFKFFFIFYTYLLFNSIINYYNYEIFLKSFSYIRFGIFFCGVFFLFDKDKSLAIKIFISAIICFTILIIDGYYQYFFDNNIFGYKVSDIGRVSSFFGEELILGSYISRLYPIIFGLFLISPIKNKFFFFILFAIIFILSEALVFLSGDRSAFFYINLSAIFTILLIKKYKFFRFTVLISSIFIIVIISVFNENAKNRIINKTLNQTGLINIFSDNKNKEQIYLFSKEHNDHYLSAKKMFEKNKIIGIGPRNFRNYCNEEPYKVSNLSCSTHPHNTYVQILSELGLIGFTFIILIFLIFLIYTYKHLYLSFKGKILFSDFQICIISAMLISIWPFIPTGNFFNNWLSIIYYFPIGIFLWSRKNNI